MRQLVKKVQGHWKNFAGVLDKPETTHYKGVTPARGQHGSALDAQIAQLVEQRIENPRVGGSIPPPATIQINGLHAFIRCKPLCFV